ncbi:M48 family metallopeptidase [Halobacillus sp. Nhm2S1]|uniref:M48 family metallopeptidase n=1 Tax=Halobacillus sp. Nhm2S1 TaxID=2866716 RepID=UPI001C736522|nr:SprT family zinc-dependent metalloprotease [Halobacillus sp. Nhm2S1]MBX0358364.1 M48 family metallopeptidase [Halobacillus sp. Nhm2S1]
MPQVQYGTTTIDYELLNMKRKDLKITVDLVNGVQVAAPEETSLETIEKAIKQRASWITSKLREIEQVHTPSFKKEYVSGEKFPYLGRHYRLKVHKEAVPTPVLKFHQGKFIAIVPRDWEYEQVEKVLEAKLIQWYRDHGIVKVKERAEIYKEILGVSPNSLQLRTQHKRWGTCTPNGDIYLNWRIVMAPVSVIDYVIVHELAHLIVPEHNEKFWNVVQSVLFDYEKSKEWLRVQGMELHTIGS